MPTSSNRINTKLHCQTCAKQRKMVSFLAINTENKDDKNVYPFDIRRFLDMIKSDTMVHLPKYYVGTCGVCFQRTYFRGQHHGKKLDVVVL
jgi:hypothetical protein